MSNEEIQLTIKVTGGSPLSIDANKDWEVSKIKHICLEKTQIPIDQQRLIYKGKILKDGEKLSSLGVLTGHTMHLVRSVQSSGSNPSNAAPALSTPGDAIPQASAGTVPAAVGIGIPPVGMGTGIPGNSFGFALGDPNNNEFLQTMVNNLLSGNAGANAAAAETQGNQNNLFSSVVSQFTTALRNNPQAFAGFDAFANSLYSQPIYGQVPATQGGTGAGVAASAATNTSTSTPATSTNIAGSVPVGVAGLGGAQGNNAVSMDIWNTPQMPIDGATLNWMLEVISRNPQLVQNAVSLLRGFTANQPGTANQQGAVDQQGTANPLGVGGQPLPNQPGVGGQPFANQPGIGGQPFANQPGVGGPPIPAFNPADMANLAAQIPNLNALASQLLGGGGGGGMMDSRPPEQLYATQLRSLQEMGFIDTAANIRALQETGGDVNAAITRLLEGGFGN